MGIVITNIQLINRIFIKEGLHLDTFKFLEDNDICYIAGNQGKPKPGPFIMSMYLKGKNIKSDIFAGILKEASKFFDIYNGTKPATYAEFLVNYVIEIGDELRNATSNLVLYFDTITQETKITVFDTSNVILKINKSLQERLSQEDVLFFIKQNKFFGELATAESTD